MAGRGGRQAFTISNMSGRMYVDRGITVPNVTFFDSNTSSIYTIDMGSSGISISGDILPLGDDSLGNDSNISTL